VTVPETDDVAPNPDPLPEPDPEPARFYPSTIGGLLYLLALAAVVAGVALTVLEGWRTGVRWMGGGLVFAAGCRLLLPTRQAGMLAVRHRLIDVVMVAVVGGMLIFLTTWIPNQPL
jgi:hypothetical protein